MRSCIKTLWLREGMKAATIAEKKWRTRVNRLFIVLCNVTKGAIQCLYLRLKKLYYLIGAKLIFRSAPNRRTIEEPKEVLTFNLCQTIIHFCNRVYESWRRLTKFSPSNQSRTNSRSTYVSKSYEAKLFIKENYEQCILGCKYLYNW